MIVLDKFTLLKDVPNALRLPDSVIKANSVKNANETIKSVMKIMDKRIDHFTNKAVFNYVKKEKFHVIYTPKYNLPVSYNLLTKGIVINLSAFGTRDVTPVNPSPRDIYACFVYGICLSRLMLGKAKVPDRFSPNIAAFLMTVLFRVFGKEYGLLGYYSTQIPRLKFLVSCYVNAAFFGIKGEKNYKISSVGIGLDYNEYKDQLNEFDFSKIDDFIKALSELKVFPGMSKYSFTSKLFKMLTVNFLPAIEDCSRFMSVMVTSNVPGVTFIPAAFYRYNETEFDNIMKLSKIIFK